MTTRRRLGCARRLRSGARGALVAARPSLWATAVRQARAPRAARAGGAGAPFLPVPDPDYLRFRFETQYGAATPPDPRDLVAYLEWCRAMGNPRPARGPHR